MTEFELISKLSKELSTSPAVVAGIGEDCAVIDNGTSNYLLLKTDAVVEGIHFEKDTPPEKVGYKALARCLSDIAAMGGKPQWALITLGVPSADNLEFLQGVYKSINSLGTTFGVSVVGGETVKNPERLFISVTLTGQVDKNSCCFRSGAKPGDAIFVSGELGGTITGKHLDFVPRLREGQWLASHFKITSMIDVSDGLAGDLKHIMKASKVGADLLTTAVPISKAAKLQARAESSEKTPLLAALTDGEDFELLFTVASAQAVPLLDGWKKEFPETKLSCIGKITEGSSLLLRSQTGVHEFTGHGYMHFK